jgi:hypothetical protein
MTRLTNDMRDSIRRNIMKGLPNRNYETEIYNLLQGVVVAFMDPRVKAVYEDVSLRPLLQRHDVRISTGSKNLYLYNATDRYIVGLNKQMEIRIADYDLPDRVPEGSMYHHILFKTKLVELVRAHYAQDELREQVSKRLKANLAAATTIKRLFEILEPELHGYIPVIVEGKSTLPACVAPVVDDLKKLGLVVPEVPKASA